MHVLEVVAHLSNATCSVIVAQHSNVPYIAYIGTPLNDATVDTYLLQRSVVGGGIDNALYPWLIGEPAKGWMGRPGILCRSQHGTPIFTQFHIVSVTTKNTAVTIVLDDNVHALRAEIELIAHATGPLLLTARVTNNAAHPMYLDALQLAVPVGAHCAEVITLGGRHAMEALEHRHSWQRTAVALENRSGRTSHEQMGVVFTGTQNFSEEHGEVWGIHTAWSGNFDIYCDALTESLRVVHVGELLTPGELALQPGETYTTPQTVVAYSGRGINAVSQQFHAYMRSKHPVDVSRPVILNTWEAVYFNHDVETLKKLATEAAAVGIERFVLDDGWFHNRRNDTAGLGDWWVDTTVWPDGLRPLVNHVRSLGMEFGLWCEPEMVNPDSELFRKHPDWALHGTHANPVLGRHQLVLNMARDDVRDYLFTSLSKVFGAYDISYVKWDHNRPVVGALSHEHTLGVYDLFARLTQAFPSIHFESCASGGGRIDMGIAQFVERFWTSDSIDALDRLAIQKGVSKVIPIEMLGSHIGSPTCHTTGRKHALSFRAATAMFGWLGVEWNLLTMTEREKENLSHALGLYKQHRALLHSGLYYRWDNPDPSLHTHGVFAHDYTQALIAVSRLSNSASHHTLPLRINGLHPGSRYRVERIDNGTPRWALHRQLPEWVNNGLTATGEQLAHIGLPIPPLLPESTLLIHLTQVTSS